MSPEAVRAFMTHVEADLSNLVAELMREQVPQEPTRLYHYTSTDGLIGIASSRKFFLSDMMASTDQSEVRHGVDTVRRVLEEHKGDPIADSFVHSFSDSTLWWGIGKHIFVHAICFCEKGDVLTQWRSYSPVGGVAIALNFSELMERATRADFAFGRMIYSPEAQRDLVRRMFNRGRDHFHQLLKNLSGLGQAEREQAINEILILISRPLLTLALFFKHLAFASEEEWRVLKIEAADNSTSLRFRGRSGTIIPYVELDFEPSLITEIRCSPGYWSRSSLHAIGRLSRSLGSVEVTHSDLPL